MKIGIIREIAILPRELLEIVYKELQAKKSKSNSK